MSEKTYTVRCARLDPERSNAVHYDSYQVPIEEGWSVLNVLTYIFEKLDPTLAFYGPCRIGKCVGCHVKVDGKVRFACTELAPHAEFTVEAMTGRALIRDLVVDRTRVSDAVE